MTQPPTKQHLELSLSGIASSLQQMRTSLVAGELRLEPGAGAALRTKLADTADKTLRIRQQVGTLSTPASLGTNAVSTSMAGKFAGRGDGGTLALGPLLDKYRAMLLEMRDVVDEAMRRYNVSDEGIAGDLGGR